MNTKPASDSFASSAPIEPSGAASYGKATGRLIRDGWTSDNGGLSWQLAAPHAAQPLVPTGSTHKVQIRSFGGGHAPAKHSLALRILASLRADVLSVGELRELELAACALEAIGQ